MYRPSASFVECCLSKKVNHPNASKSVSYPVPACFSEIPRKYILKIGGKLMKKKFMKRVISILLSVAVLCCAAGAEGLLISAENRYDITLTITYPRSGEAPEIPSDFESLSSLDLTYLGCEWKTADNTEQWDDGTEFIEWMYTFVNSRNYNSLNTFEDGIMYHQRT